MYLRPKSSPAPRECWCPRGARSQRPALVRAAPLRSGLPSCQEPPFFAFSLAGLLCAAASQHLIRRLRRIPRSFPPRDAAGRARWSFIFCGPQERTRPLAGPANEPVFYRWLFGRPAGRRQWLPRLTTGHEVQRNAIIYCAGQVCFCYFYRSSDRMTGRCQPASAKERREADDRRVIFGSQRPRTDDQFPGSFWDIGTSDVPAVALQLPRNNLGYSELAHSATSTRSSVQTPTQTKAWHRISFSCLSRLR